MYFTKYIKKLIHNIRFYVLSGSIALSYIIYLVISLSTPPGYGQVVQLEETYGFAALIYLFLVLLAGPLCYTFKFLPFRGHYLKARRALGVAAFYFASLHGIIALNGELGGFAGLSYLDYQTYNIVVIGFIALIIMALLAITSFDFVVDKISFPLWKLLHRLVYLAALLVILHVALLGISYSPLTGIIPQTTFFAVAFLLLLESPRLDAVVKKFIRLPAIGLSTAAVAILLGVLYFGVINPIGGGGGVAFNIHANMQKAALQALSQPTQNSQGGIPGNQYNISMRTDPANPQPDQQVTLYFSVYNSSSGNLVTFFNMLYGKPMHLIIVNSKLTYFQHLLPTNDVDSEEYSITTEFPKADMYHFYLEFQPLGAGIQQGALTLPIGNAPTLPSVSKAKPDVHKTKNYGKYAVSVDTNAELNATGMTEGDGVIAYTIKYTKPQKKHLTSLQSYLEGYGQLTLINQNTFDIIRIKPAITDEPAADGTGVVVNFSPKPSTGVIKPGIYRAFAEFKPDNHLFTAIYTMKINK
jgi:DMSO/TMAO reductase YedYZ heme-binding membrane subunit